jgi:hypothetical protein
MQEVAHKEENHELVSPDSIYSGHSSSQLLDARFGGCRCYLDYLLIRRTLKLQQLITHRRYSPLSAPRSQFGARRVIPLIHRRFRVSNSIQIQNSRRPKIITRRALSAIPRPPSARFVCVKKDPSPAGVFFMRLGLAQYAAFRLVPAASRCSPRSDAPRSAIDPPQDRNNRQ